MIEYDIYNFYIILIYMWKINLAMAGGWTWWHVFPVKSIIEFINSKDEYRQEVSKIVRFWEKKSLESEIFTKISKNNQNLFFQTIVSGKYRRETPIKSKLKNIRDIFKFGRWIIQSVFYLKKYKIDVIFCKWWYVALPVVIAWKILGKKIVVHESDVHSWLVNKIAAKFASTVFTWFDNVLPNSITVGQILSDDIICTQSIKNINLYKEKWEELTLAEQLFYTDPKKTYLLVMWWSQGSKRLYQNLLESIQENKNIYSNYEIFLVLWKENQDLKPNFDSLKNVHTFDFLSQQDMWLLLKYCDISLTRAWTTSLAEQKLYNLKIVMVPIPWTHDQYDNAKFYVEQYDDILLDSNDPNYKENMLSIFTKYQNFKKETIKKDILSEISVAKQKITEALLK